MIRGSCIFIVFIHLSQKCPMMTIMRIEKKIIQKGIRKNYLSMFLE